jgi:AraC family transcriptional regulator of adaptative response / DNA-3-methyladenine glycosylase II
VAEAGGRRAAAAVRPAAPAAPAASGDATPAAPAVPATAGAVRLRLPLPVPYDLDWVLGFLADRAAPAIERVTPGEVLRVVRIAGAPVLLSVRPAAARRGAVRSLTVVAAPAGPGAAPPAAAAVRQLVRRMFDLDTDLTPFLRLARADRVLAPLAARSPGLRLPQLPDPFEAALRAIVGQQVSVAGARTVIDRLIRQLGEPVPGDDRGLAAFPLPEAVAAAPVERLTALGLTRAKAAALRGVAAATHDGSLDWTALRTAPAAAAAAALVALPGIGPWTASYIRMRALGDGDAFPAADLGILKALARPTVAAALALAEGWRPYRAYAAIHLWRSLAL